MTIGRNYLFLFFLVTLNVSCVKEISSKEEFHTLSHSAGLGHFYYIGSENNFHYFAKDSFLSFTTYYKYPKDQYSTENPFPRTEDKSKWIPYLIDGNEKTEGFE